MELFLASVVLGIVPMVVYALIIWRLDRWEKEPFSLMLAAFFWGAIPSVIFAVIAQIILGTAPVPSGEVTLMSELYEGSIIAPLTEELIKGLGIYLIFIFFRREIDSVLDGLIYGSMVGFGFSAVENIMYFSGQEDIVSLFVLFFLRAFLFGMLHAFFTGLSGVGFALGKFSANPFMKVLWPVLGIGAAMVTHALHNFFATLGGEHILYAIGGTTCGFIWFVVTFIVCLSHENRWIRIHLAEEVKSGVLHAEQALHAAHFWSRSSLSAFSTGLGTYLKRKKLLHEATELAYQKQKLFRFGSSPEGEQRVVQLREKVRILSRIDPLVLSGIIQSGRLLPPPLPPVRRLPPPLPKNNQV